MPSLQKPAAVLLFGAAALSLLGADAFSARAAGQGAAPAQGEKKTAVDEKAIRALIAHLAAESFDKREAAHKRLAEIGGPALELLKQTAKEATDAEVRQHAAQLMQEIQEIGLHLVRADFYHDFRKKGVSRESFSITGPASAKRVKSEPEGLRITLADEKDIPLSVVGVAPQLRVRGDFEITVGYEILRADKPEEGFGVGLEVYLATDTRTKEAIAFDRRLLPDGRDVYICNRNTTDQEGRRVYGTLDEKPAQGKSGQVRITRIGSKAAISVHDGAGKGFRVVHRVDFGTEELALLRLGANQGGARCAVDLRLHDLRVRGADASAFKFTGGQKTTPVK